MGMTLLLCYMLRNDAFDAVYFVPAESGLWNEEKKTMNQQPITSLKGIGEKTAKLFAKLGVETVEELLHDYPRAYDAYEKTAGKRDVCGIRPAYENTVRAPV